ncbi:hypothetical protein HHK36_023080 [Tetracentron sinense]|uniref:Uncharacterized protein n=1 Tax=Tetracentron sinense TaxID=13715 RepID=A0A835D7D8_TETSI|nr:hypothetical protein HHK36_023080 [Tetracentron sinense]
MCEANVPSSCNHCLQCRPSEYIRLVQHLIEECLIFHMDRDECVRALENRASIQPAVTLAVWKELLKENPEFFSAYRSAVPGELVDN